jgi:hypothetical protein
MRARIGNETPDKNEHTKPKCAIAVIATILPLNTMFMFSILIIGISLLSLSVSTIMINAQTSNDGISDSVVGGRHMGICVVGVRSPCNGPSN